MMKGLNLKILFLFVLLFPNFHLFAQKHFNLTVHLPQGIHSEKVEAWLEDGKTAIKMVPQLKSRDQMVLSGDYYAIYAAVRIQYPTDPPIMGFGNTFFIGEEPALIKFLPSNSAEYPFKNYTLENALDFQKEKKEMQDFCLAARRKALDYEAQYGDQVFGPDTAIHNHHLRLANAVREKELQYIIGHTNSYYSFYSFRSDIAWSTIVSADSLLAVFNGFPGKFTNSDEGNYWAQFLNGRQLQQNKGNAIDFTTKDINKNTVRLSDFKGKKYVLLQFWATWCLPCLKEMPAVKEINDHYKSKGLQIISVGLPSDYNKYLATIKKLQMDWINVYNDSTVMNKYGMPTPPRVCFIDKTGKVVYDRVGVQNNDFKLTELKAKMKEVLGN